MRTGIPKTGSTIDAEALNEQFVRTPMRWVPARSTKLLSCYPDINWNNALIEQGTKGIANGCRLGVDMNDTTKLECLGDFNIDAVAICWTYLSI